MIGTIARPMRQALVHSRFSGLTRFLAIACLLSLAGCGTVNPATGERQFTPFMSEGREQQVGAAEHPKILQQFGGVYDDPELGAYVAGIGTRLVAASETPDESFTFTVLDTPTVNAFALPGGYIYVTRGLLALVNTEAELAGVLAHEIGHVTARHTAQRYNRAVTTSLLSGILGIATGSQAVAQLGQVVGAGYLAHYSRGQEYEADLLGVRYMARIGYNPLAQADLLSSLQRERRLAQQLAGREGEDPTASFFATHPNTLERVQRAIAAAHEQTVAQADRYGRDPWLQQIDGLVWGDSAEQGFVRDRTFAHPKLRVAFTAPDGYELINRSDAVYAKGPGEVLVRFDTAPRSGDPVSHLRAEWGRQLALSQVERIEVNGMPGATATARANTDAGARDLRLVVVDGDQRFYRFLILTPPQETARQATALQRLTYSLRRLSAREADALRPYRIQVVPVGAGDSVEGLARRMAVDKLPVERFRVLNALEPGDRLAPGERAKLIVE